MSSSLTVSHKRNNIIENYYINKNLSKYNKTIEEYSKCIIKNLIFHKKSHFTSIFTEYLILDDNQEFLYELFPKKYSLLNIPFYTKFQYQLKYFPIIVDECGRTHINKNIKMKKILYTYLSEKTKQTTDISKIFNKKYSYFLPKNISEIKRTNIKNKDKDKDINESESTIDNVNANDDISLSIDLKINQNYDNKILNENIGFVKGKNGKNDNELIKMLRLLNPIDTTNIYQNNKPKIINKNKLIYLNYINNKKSIDKYRHTEIEGTKNIISTKNMIEKISDEKNHKKKINSLSNKSKKIINIIYKKDIIFCSKSNNNSQKSLNIKKTSNNNFNNNNNIIVLNKYSDYTTSTKTNSHSNSYKNKSRNKHIDTNSPKNFLEKNDTEKNLKLQNYSENILITQFTPYYNESKILKEETKESKKILINKGLYNTKKYNKRNIIPHQKKIIINNNGNGNDNNEIINKNKINNIKILKNNNNKRDINNNKNKNKKDSNRKFIDISPDIKKSKLLPFYKNCNNNIISNSKYFKKQKSVDNQSLIIFNNNKNKNPHHNQQSEKKNQNIIIIKKKNSNNINIYK